MILTSRDRNVDSFKAFIFCASCIYLWLLQLFLLMQNHTAIGTEVAKLSAFNKVQYPPCHDIINGYFKFEVLCDHNYKKSFTCVECGRYPPILISDVNKKCCFRLKGNITTNILDYEG